MAARCKWAHICRVYRSNNYEMIVRCGECEFFGGHLSLFLCDKYSECRYCDNHDKPEICRDCEMSFNYSHFRGCLDG